jgi:hypothetical protein
MNGWKALDRLLQTDPRDAGCDETMEPLHVYAELVAIDRAQRSSVIRRSGRICVRAPVRE